MQGTATTEAPPRLISQAEVAKYLGVSDRTIRNYVATGALRAYRIKGSRLMRFDADDVAALLVEIPTVGSIAR